MSQQTLTFSITNKDGKLAPHAAFLRQLFGPDTIHRVSLQQFFDLLGLSDKDVKEFIAENGAAGCWTGDLVISFNAQPNELVLLGYERRTGAADDS
jgi:hypothetical protein